MTIVRRALLAIMACATLAACSVWGDDKRGDGCDVDGHHHQLGEVFPMDCNTCTCTATGASCTIVGCGPRPDANPASCAADLACPGPSCGGYCCNAGEKCVNDACTCGGQPGCGSGDTCASAGPAGGSACGSICCGKSGPCPR
jgi:hypothetical protein